GAGAPNHGKPNQPKPPQARVAATGAALQAEASPGGPLFFQRPSHVPGPRGQTRTRMRGRSSLELAQEARQRVAAALAEQSAAMMVWSQSQGLTTERVQRCERIKELFVVGTIVPPDGKPKVSQNDIKSKFDIIKAILTRLKGRP
ncbi:unnamed protein product, partial [Prorocentrum cordatum]